jgi:hypothetical protein
MRPSEGEPRHAHRRPPPRRAAPVPPPCGWRRDDAATRRMTAAERALLERLAASERGLLHLSHPGRAAAAVDAYEAEVDGLCALYARGYATRPVTRRNGTYARGRFAAVHAQITDLGRAALDG